MKSPRSTARSLNRVPVEEQSWSEVGFLSPGCVSIFSTWPSSDRTNADSELKKKSTMGEVRSRQRCRMLFVSMSKVKQLPFEKPIHKPVRPSYFASCNSMEGLVISPKSSNWPRPGLNLKTLPSKPAAHTCCAGPTKTSTILATGSPVSSIPGIWKVCVLCPS